MAMRASDIVSIESESGVLATLIQHPEFIFESDFLLPQHFANNDNRAIYSAIIRLTDQGIYQADAYNIKETLDSAEATRNLAKDITIERLNEMVEMSDVIARHTVQEYVMLARNVMNTAKRRQIFNVLSRCQSMCFRADGEDITQTVYDELDDVMSDFATVDRAPPMKDIIDDMWLDIESRQGDNCSGIPFKFPALNEYATIEPGELFIFAAEAKQGKSMMLLNCAVDLLRKGKSVLYIDSELNTRMFTSRLLAHLSGVDHRMLKAGNYTEEELDKILEAKAWMKNKKFTHVYVPMFDIQTIYTTVKKVYHTQGIDVLIVDYFKSSGDGDAFTSYQELGKFVDFLRSPFVQECA